MKALTEKPSSKNVPTRNRQETNFKKNSMNRGVPYFSGSIPFIQGKSICPCDGGCPRCSGIVQPKLTTGQPNDKYELTSDIESGINSLKGGGEPLPESIRSFFELRFGTDLSQVRVHNNANSDRLNNSLNARAFTAGKDILFARNEYRPWSNEGRSLIAHELTHAIQQSSIHTPVEETGRLNSRISNTDRGIVQRHCGRSFKFDGVVVEGAPPIFPPGFDFLPFFLALNFRIGDYITHMQNQFLTVGDIAERAIELWVKHLTGMCVIVDSIGLRRGSYRRAVMIALEVYKCQS